MFAKLTELARRPAPFEAYTAAEMWADPHISERLLRLHLDPDVELASRNHKFMNASIAWLTDRFVIGPGRSVCDFGCGPGLYTQAFAEAGAEVRGIDFSPRSINHARQAAALAGVEVDYVLGSYLDYVPDRRFDLATMIYVDFCALSPPQRAKLLETMRNGLAEGGRIFLDVLSLAHFERTKEAVELTEEPEGGFWAPGPHFVLRHDWKYGPEKLFLSRHTVIEPERTREVFNWLQCFSLASLSTEVEAAGLEIVDMWGDVAGRPYEPTDAQFAVELRARA